MNNKKKGIIIGIVVMLLIAGISFFFLKKDGPEKEVEKEEAVVKEASKVDREQRTIYEQIEPSLREDGLGEMMEAHAYSSKYFLSTTEKNVKSYEDNEFANRIIWSEVKKGKVESTPLTEEEGLFVLIKEKGSPFIQSGNDTLVVFYERDDSLQSDVGRAHVYKLTGKGTLKKVFEPNGVYGGVKKDKNGHLIVLEKQFDDPLGRYPLALKPYDLHYRKYEKEKWKTIQVETVRPIEKKKK